MNVDGYYFQNGVRRQKYTLMFHVIYVNVCEATLVSSNESQVKISNFFFVSLFRSESRRKINAVIILRHRLLFLFLVFFFYYNDSLTEMYLQ